MPFIKEKKFGVPRVKIRPPSISQPKISMKAAIPGQALADRAIKTNPGMAGRESVGNLLANASAFSVNPAKKKKIPGLNKIANELSGKPKFSL